MNAVTVALMTFASTFGSALVATYLRQLLPAPHLSKESQDVVRLGMGLIATMTALLLGLVTASARSAFDEEDKNVRTSAVNVLTLDRDLARYGPETRPMRELLRRAVEFRLASTWPTKHDAASTFGAPLSTSAVEDFESQILRLSAETDEQRRLKDNAVKLSEEVMKTRWSILARSSSIPKPFLTVVILWLSVTFASFGLYAPRNATVVAALCVAAASVAAAVFILMELDGPFEGLIKVSGEPFRFALANLGK